MTQALHLRRESRQLGSSVLTWEARPTFHPARARSRTATFVLIIALAIVVGLVWHDMLLAVLLVLGVVTLGLERRATAMLIRAELDTRGIRINGRLHLYGDMKSFWIEYVPGGLKELSIQSKRWYLPYLKIPLGRQDPLAVRIRLLEFIPEHKHQLSFVDALMARLGL